MKIDSISSNLTRLLTIYGPGVEVGVGMGVGVGVGVGVGDGVGVGVVSSSAVTDAIAKSRKKRTLLEGLSGSITVKEYDELNPIVPSPICVS